MYDDFDVYDSFLDDYNDQLDDLSIHEEAARDMYESELQDIDEYWDREDEYIRESGIYTKEEIEQILDEHNDMRRSQQEDARDEFEMEMDSLQFDREQLEFDREMAEMERGYFLRERAPQMYSYPKPPRKSSFVKDTITAAAIFHFLKKLF